MRMMKFTERCYINPETIATISVVKVNYEINLPYEVIIECQNGAKFTVSSYKDRKDALKSLRALNKKLREEY